MEHSPSTPQRHVRFHLQDKENTVHPLPTKACGDDIVNTATPFSTPVPQKPPSSASKRLRHQFQQQCSVTNSNIGPALEQTLDNTEVKSNSDINTQKRGLLSQQHKESSNETAVRRDQDPVASTLLQDDADFDMDVVIMSGDLKDWPGLIRPVATKFHPM
ncbi:hypothetical protein MHU86_20858 [Fragilaria crotonensis]|nr:hypothetical protein MHU86_20858 [Fragilaria crotonensis]